MTTWTRRRFLEFLRSSSQALAAVSLVPGATGCTRKPSSAPLPSLAPSRLDAVNLVEGLSWREMIRFNTPINANGDRFGVNNDYLELVPAPGRPLTKSALLWVNHEYPSMLELHGSYVPTRTREQVDLERRAVGGSILRIENTDAGWQVVYDDPYNRRVSGETPIPMVSPRPIAGSATAIGTLANCAGGKTPWNTVLTCEENYESYYGEVEFTGGKRARRDGPLGWSAHYDLPPEHYGWVVEVDPTTGASKKLTALGRFSHECATVRPGSDGRCVVYSSDDRQGGSLYKFIADRRGSLETGTLYVANLDEGRWEPLILDRPELENVFRDEVDLLVQTRRAAALVGATPLDRPEDIEIDPATGNVLVALTNNVSRGNFHGSILKLSERNDDPLALEFTHASLLMGGDETGLSCPDNLTFDRQGNLWITTDVYGGSQQEPEYVRFGHNGLFYVPMTGPQAGEVFRVATAPVAAEFTGPKFTPDGRTLLLAVQHPGETTRSPDRITSHWPDGGDAMPACAVIALSGPLLDRLVASAANA
ncbi:MAG: alkaline phosphatase PhoX [Myxococcota bacterium]